MVGLVAAAVPYVAAFVVPLAVIWIAANASEGLAGTWTMLIAIPALAVGALLGYHLEMWGWARGVVWVLLLVATLFVVIRLLVWLGSGAGIVRHRYRTRRRLHAALPPKVEFWVPPDESLKPALVELGGIGQRRSWGTSRCKRLPVGLMVAAGGVTLKVIEPTTTRGVTLEVTTSTSRRVAVVALGPAYDLLRVCELEGFRSSD